MLTILSKGSFAVKGSKDIGCKLEGEIRSREGSKKNPKLETQQHVCYADVKD